MAQTHDPARKVPTRRMSFDEHFADIPKYFATDGDLIQTHLATVLSGLFPDGEDFFVRSVRAFRDEITDPELKRQVAGFIGQEAMHGREHRALNDRFAELGYLSKTVERVICRALALRERVCTQKSSLAETAAAEHFTATLAELVLSSQETRDLFGDPTVRDLFLWHALEESEHKAVAFDVYRAVGGSERVRVWTMKFLRVGFVSFVALFTALSLLRDRRTYRKGELRASWRRLRTSPLMTKGVWKKLCDYDRPDFHPEDSDTTGLVDHWREELFGNDGTLNDKLIRSVA